MRHFWRVRKVCFVGFGSPPRNGDGDLPIGFDRIWWKPHRCSENTTPVEQLTDWLRSDLLETRLENTRRGYWRLRAYRLASIGFVGNDLAE